ncbi:MAG: CpaE family protein [Candidatus Nanopelagicaceae bacterium]
MILYFGTNGTEVDRFKFALGEEIIPSGTINEITDQLENNEGIQIVLIGPDVNLKDALQLAQVIQLRFMGKSAILIRRKLDVTILSEAIRAGVSDVLVVEDSQALVEARTRALLRSEKIRTNSPEKFNGRHGKIILVFSAKGGCGKTTLSINLANALSEVYKKDVCLIDFDLQFGDIAIALQTEPIKTVSQAIGMRENLDELGVKSLITNKSEHLDLLLAPTNPTDVEFISADLVEKILTNLRNSYDFLVIDSPPAFTDVVLKSFDMMDKCFLLTTLDMPAVKNMRVVIETLSALKVNPEKIEYVLNRSNLNTNLSPEEIEDILGQKFVSKIPSNAEVSTSANVGKSLIEYDLKNPVSQEISLIARNLVDEYFPDSGKSRVSNKKKSHKL